MNAISQDGSAAIAYEPKFQFSSEVLPPDDFLYIDGIHPPKNFVVSRNIDGSPLSYFGDSVWDWTPYSSSANKCVFRFDTWFNEDPDERHQNLAMECRLILFSLIWLSHDAPLSFSSLVKYHYTVVRIAEFIKDTSITICEFLGDSNLIMRFLSENGDYHAGYLRRLIEKLGGMDSCLVDAPKPTKAQIADLVKRTKRHRKNYQQTAPIPTRIFAEILSSVTGKLESFSDHSDQILTLAKDCTEDPLMGRGRSHQRRIVGGAEALEQTGARPRFRELLVERGLAKYFEDNCIVPSVKGLSHCLWSAQNYAAVIIYAYSGMRRDELRGLYTGCLKTIRVRGRKCYVIDGHTTKNSGGRKKKARWVTSVEGARAIRTAEKIAKFINCCVLEQTNLAVTDKQRPPLFASTNHLSLTARQPRLLRGELRRGWLAASWDKEFEASITPTITDEDIRELELIDPHRNWRSDTNYEIGRVWHLTALQLRRSLALYASRSGCVSLPTLRRQLQHITEDLALYYARGSHFAKSLTNGNGDFLQLYQASQAESETLAYINNVLFSDEQLFGGHGVVIKRPQAGYAVLESRESTEKMIRRGELAYKETALGGCVKLGDCNEKALRSLVSCLKCPKAVVKVSKLELVISAQKALVTSLDSDSVEWRTETADLEELQSAKKRYLEIG